MFFVVFFWGVSIKPKARTLIQARKSRLNASTCFSVEISGLIHVEISCLCIIWTFDVSKNKLEFRKEECKFPKRKTKIKFKVNTKGVGKKATRTWWVFSKQKLGLRKMQRTSAKFTAERLEGVCFSQYFYVRWNVFCEEQEIALEDEVDKFESSTRHFAITCGVWALSSKQPASNSLMPRTAEDSETVSDHFANYTGTFFPENRPVSVCRLRCSPPFVKVERVATLKVHWSSGRFFPPPKKESK